MDIDADATIKKLGGPDRVADLIAAETGVRLGRTAVANWRLADRQVPWRWRPVLEKLLKRRRVK